MLSSDLILTFPVRPDDRGLLVFAETERQIPFVVKRAYWVQSKAGVRRGFHAHRALRQVAVCLSGSCDFLLDDGSVRYTVTLDRPDQGLLIERMIWREFELSENATLLVFASEYFDEDDYIRNYDEFQKLVHRASDL